MEFIGRREIISIPTLGNSRVEAKIDTGAYRTAVHCLSCDEITAEDSKLLRAIFELEEGKLFSIDFRDYRQRMVRNSFGDSEMRYCVVLSMRIGSKRIKSEVSLTNRSGMRYQVLLGRKTLKNRFVVDVSQKYLTAKKRKK